MQAWLTLKLARKYAHIYVHIYASGIQPLRNIFAHLYMDRKRVQLANLGFDT
jgi:hypothetical protein